MSNSKSKVNAELEKAIAKMLKEVMNSHEHSLTDKCKVVDRALKLEALKAKIDDSAYASAYAEEDE